MSGAFDRLASFKNLIPSRPTGRMFNSAGHAGPRRLMIFALTGLTTVAVVAWVVTSGRHAPLTSQDARMKTVDPLPGGLHTTPEQDALAARSNDAAAQAALRSGVSFTPPMAPSQTVLPPPSRVEQPDPVPPLPQGPGTVVHRSPPALVPEALRAAFPVALPAPALPAAPAIVRDPAPIRTIPVAATTNDPVVDQGYHKQIDELFSKWGGRVPRTDVVLPPTEQQQGDAAADDPPAPRRGAPSRAGAVATPVATPIAAREEAGTLLIPAGRGIYAHPILALSSDASSPVVLQADSGPIAGDRMIGTFAKQEQRLIIHVNTVVHAGENIGVDGIVTAPDTMEASVASGVDQHYVSRFLLPAAASFVAGLGQALAQTSNTQTVLSPFGGAAFATHLNIEQQLGVAAGAAAQQVGSTLNAAAPKGPTISLDANVAVGVVFLSNVTAHHQVR